jgi:hypothetical protein
LVLVVQLVAQKHKVRLEQTHHLQATRLQAVGAVVRVLLMGNHQEVLD